MSLAIRLWGGAPTWKYREVVDGVERIRRVEKTKVTGLYRFRNPPQGVEMKKHEADPSVSTNRAATSARGELAS